MNDEATRMTVISNSAVSALQGDGQSDQAAAYYILVVRPDKKVFEMRQIPIGHTTSGPEIMRLLEQALPWKYRYGLFLFKPEIETAQLARVPNFREPGDHIVVVPLERRFDETLTRGLTNPTIFNEECGNGGPFAAAYPDLVASSNTGKVLVVDARLRQRAKLAMILLALLLCPAVGLIAGHAANSVETGVAVGCAPVPVILFVGAVTWKAKKRSS